MARKSKSDWQESQRDYQKRTDSEEQLSKEITDDGDEASRDWNNQEAPSLADTAEAMNKIAEDLKSDIRQKHSEQADLVERAIEDQRTEVSDPAHEAEKRESQGAKDIETASARNERFGKILAEAADQRRDAEAFLREMADEDERDQDESKSVLESHRSDVNQSIDGVREF